MAPGDRESVAWRIATQVTALSKDARAVGLAELAYLLDMAGLEAKQHVVVKDR